MTSLTNTPSRMQQYFRWEDAGTSKSGLTRVWLLYAKKHGREEEIGEVAWYGAFRRYIYWPFDDRGLEAAALRFIADFLDKVNGEHRNRG